MRASHIARARRKTPLEVGLKVRMIHMKVGLKVRMQDSREDKDWDEDGMECVVFECDEDSLGRV